MLRPDSYKITAATAGLLDVIQAIESHVVNTSTRFSVKNTNDDTANSGDYGITLTPDATGENWDLAIHFDADYFSGRLRAFLDPQGSITNPLDSSSGSGDTSPYMSSWVVQNPLDNPEFLWAELDDSVTMVTKESDDSSGRWKAQAGRLLVPIFPDDAGENLDGLALYGTEERDEPGQNDESYVRVAKSTWNEGRSVEAETMDFSAFPNGNIRPYPNIWRDNSSNQLIGMCKTLYHWEGDTPALTRVEDDAGSGGILTLTDVGSNPDRVFAVTWDPAVSPV